MRVLVLAVLLTALAAMTSSAVDAGTSATSCAPGVHTLALGTGRPARMRVTAGTRKGKKALVVVLHGAGGSADSGLAAFETWNAPGLVLVAPASKDYTWSGVLGSDADLAGVNGALAKAYAHCPIDQRRIAIGGFSDGASYALSLGLASGDLFRSVIAFSPGGIVGSGQNGRPRFFVSHGTRDTVLPFGRTRGSIVPQLRKAGYPVTFRSFAGGHEVPPAIGKAAQRWFLSG